MRSIIEEYTKRGYCKICFATTTLEQGVNMPIDVDFIDRMGTTGVSRSAICDSIKKALDGKKKCEYAGIKFTRVKN